MDTTREDKIQYMLDRTAIFDLVRSERLARDLLQAFHAREDCWLETGQ